MSQGCPWVGNLKLCKYRVAMCCINISNSVFEISFSSFLFQDEACLIQSGLMLNPPALAFPGTRILSVHPQTHLEIFLLHVVCVHLCTCVWRPEINIACPPRLLFTLLFWSNSNLRSAKPTDQWAPSICLSLPSYHWGYKCTLPLPEFYEGAWDLN